MAPYDEAMEITPAELRARVRWAAQQGHEGYLWPEVPHADWRAGLREIERVTRAVLRAGGTGLWAEAVGTELSTVGPIRLEAPAGPRALGIAAFTSGMGPLLAWWIGRGRIEADRSVSALLDVHLRHGRERADRMHAAMLAALTLLDASGIRPVLIKSAHTANVYFPDPGTRPAADIDFAVDEPSFAAAERCLVTGGYGLAKRSRKPAKSDWIPPGAPTELRSLEFSHAASPFTLELHGGLDRDFFGVRTVRLGPFVPGDLRAAPAGLASARVLAQPLLAALLAIHASEDLHQLQLVRIVELVGVLRADEARGELDWSALAGRLARHDALRFAFPALELAERLVPGTVDAGLLALMRKAATPRMRRVLDRVGPGTAQRLEGMSLDERFVWASGPIETARRFWRMVRPPGADVPLLFRTYTARLLRLVRGRVGIRRAGDES